MRGIQDGIPGNGGASDHVCLFKHGYLETRPSEIGAANQAVMSTPNNQNFSFLTCFQNANLLLIFTKLFNLIHTPLFDSVEESFYNFLKASVMFPRRLGKCF